MILRDWVCKVFRLLFAWKRGGVILGCVDLNIEGGESLKLV